MRTRYGVSPWLVPDSSARRPDHPRLRGEHDVDVVIVGAGLTGCAAALACATAGRTVMVLDSGRVGQGGSGRCAGWLVPDPPAAFHDLAGSAGRASARRVFEAWRRAAADAVTQLKRLKIPCGLAPASLVALAAQGPGEILPRERAAREQAGLPVRSMNPAQSRRTTACEMAASGLMLGTGWTLDPYRACLGLARAAAARGVAFAERSEVRRIAPGRRHVEIQTDGGRVRASTVIVATGVPPAGFRPLERHFTARETYLVLTDPMPAAMRRRALPAGVLLVDPAVPRRRLHVTADHRLLVSGADQSATPARKKAGVLVQRTGQLMYEVLVAYPEIAGLRPALGWDAPYGATADGLPYLGPHRHYPRHLFALGGQESVTGAFLAGRVLARAVSGAATRTDAIFGWHR